VVCGKERKKRDAGKLLIQKKRWGKRITKLQVKEKRDRIGGGQGKWRKGEGNEG